MTTTIAFLDAVKARLNMPSDYALAKKLGCTHQTVSKYRVGKDFLGDTTAIRVAELLEMDPGIVIAAAHAERAKKPEERRVWEAIIQKLGGAAALVLIGIGAISAPAPAQASEAAQCVLCKTGRRASRKHQASPFAAALRAFFPIRPIQAA